MNTLPTLEQSPLQLAKRVFWLLLPLAIIAQLGANGPLLAVGLTVLPAMVLLLWVPNGPPVLLFAALMQWTQVFMPVFVAVVSGEDLGSDLRLPELNRAAYLGFLAILFLSIGMRVGSQGGRHLSRKQLSAQAREISVGALVFAYIATLLVSVSIDFLTSAIPGLRQAWVVLGKLRWIVVFLLFWASIEDPRYRLFARIVLLLEIVIGLSGFFSAFKYVLFLSIVVSVGAGIGVKVLYRPQSIVLAVLTVALVGFWQSVKTDYRDYLSQGTGSQAVLVSPEDRMRFLAVKAPSVGIAGIPEGLISAIERIGYLEFFARCLRNVPSRISYQDGKLWSEAVLHVLTPRVLFPDKGAIDDSDRTNEFSGVRVAGSDRGTSISIGYVAESYIDFGPFWMFVPIMLTGILWGRSYYWLSMQCNQSLLALSAATNLVLANALLFESSNIKILGGTITQLIVFLILLRFGGNWCWGMLTRKYVGSSPTPL